MFCIWKNSSSLFKEPPLCFFFRLQLARFSSSNFRIKITDFLQDPHVQLNLFTSGIIRFRSEFEGDFERFIIKSVGLSSCVALLRCGLKKNTQSIVLVRWGRTIYIINYYATIHFWRPRCVSPPTASTTGLLYSSTRINRRYNIFIPFSLTPNHFLRLLSILIRHFDNPSEWIFIQLWFHDRKFLKLILIVIELVEHNIFNLMGADGSWFFVGSNHCSFSLANMNLTRTDSPKEKSPVFLSIATVGREIKKFTDVIEHIVTIA